MASADDNNALLPMPSLPPIPGYDSLRGGTRPTQNVGGGGQNCPADDSGTTPPPIQRIAVQPSTHGSAMSSLTTTNNNPSTPENRGKRAHAADDSSDDDSDSDRPSPKKKLPDFNVRKSDDDSVASGDDSNGWEVEEERLTHIIAAQAETEQRIEEQEMEIIVPEVHEWEDSLEEGDPDEGAAPAGTAAAVFETIHYPFSKTTGKLLKDLAQKFRLSSSGTKRILYDRIRDCDCVEKLGADEFVYRREVLAGEKKAKWVVLTPEEPPLIRGIDMATGAQVGFYGPTNKENAVGGKRSNFLTKEKIARPNFVPKKRKGFKKRSSPRRRILHESPESSRAADAPPATDGPPAADAPPAADEATPIHSPTDFGDPSDACRKLIPPLKFARPKDFFNTQLTPEFIQWLVDATNRRAVADGAGTGSYKDWTPLDREELYKFIGLLFANGLSPKPQFEYWFEGTEREPLFGNDKYSKAMDKHDRTTGRRTSGKRRYKMFRRYFTMADYRDNPKQKQQENPLWKVQELLDELNKQAKDMWLPGKWVAIDEQTIGFQGASSMKIRISYKREGDGFQCDALCDRGYTYSFWFRCGKPPVIPQTFKHHDLSPTAKRVVWLALRVPNEWTRIYMDNLFNSKKLFAALYQAKALAHGVARTSHRGLPNLIIQREEKNKDRAEKLRGTTMAARLVDCADCPDLLAVSTYDTKPVHMLSTAADSVEWMVSQKKVWSEEAHRKAFVKFLRLNVIDEYNNNMNSTDIADQLRGVYRPDHWMRNRKWWWAIWIWGIGVAGVNGYRIYEVMYEEQKRLDKNSVPPRWSHARFLEELVNDFMFPGETSKHLYVLQSMDDSTFASSVKSTRNFSLYGSNAPKIDYDFSCASGCKDFLKAVKPHRLNKLRLSNGFFTHRFDGQRHCYIPARAGDMCQLCYHTWFYEYDDLQKKDSYKERNRFRIQRCLVCNVNLCMDCDHSFHGADLTAVTI